MPAPSNGTCRPAAAGDSSRSACSTARNGGRIVPPADAGCAAPRLETARLVLRAPRPEDAGWIERLAGDWEVAKLTARIPHPYPPGEAARFIASLPEGDGLTFAIERRGDAETIGMIGARPGDAEAELGYWIGRPFWGQGFASEALEALVRHLFLRHRFQRLVASARPENRASIRVQEKTGFAFAGRGEEAAPARGGVMPVEFRALDRAGWERRRAASPIPNLLVAAVALVDADGRILLQQRPPGKEMAGLWEFPGGKIQPGET
ncbi:MAG: GNAT family N-acetyltransferase, partial [Solirubrobacterales bacterium]